MMQFQSQEALLEELMICQDESRKFRDRLCRIISWIRVIQAKGVHVPEELEKDLDLSFQYAYLEKQTLQEQLELKIEHESSDENDEDDSDQIGMADMFHPMRSSANNFEQELLESDNESEPEKCERTSDQNSDKIRVVDINTILGPKPSTSSSETHKELKTTEPAKNEQKFNCQDCEAEFTSVYALITHAMIHLTPMMLSVNKASPVPPSNFSKEQSAAHPIPKTNSEVNAEIDGLRDLLPDSVPAANAPPAKAGLKSPIALKYGQSLASTALEEKDNTRLMGNKNTDQRSIINPQQSLQSKKNDTVRMNEENSQENEHTLQSHLPNTPHVHPDLGERSVSKLDEDKDFILTPCHFCCSFHRRGEYCAVLHSPLPRKHPALKEIRRNNRKKIPLILPGYLQQEQERKMRNRKANAKKRKMDQQHRHERTLYPSLPSWKKPNIASHRTAAGEPDADPKSVQILTSEKKNKVHRDPAEKTTVAQKKGETEIANLNILQLGGMQKTTTALNHLNKSTSAVTGTRHFVIPKNKRNIETEATTAANAPLALKKPRLSGDNVTSSSMPPPPSTNNVHVRTFVPRPRFNHRIGAYQSHPCRMCYDVHPRGLCPMQRFPIPMRFPFPHPPGFRVRRPMGFPFPPPPPSLGFRFRHPMDDSKERQ